MLIAETAPLPLFQRGSWAFLGHQSNLCLPSPPGSLLTSNRLHIPFVPRRFLPGYPLSRRRPSTLTFQPLQARLPAPPPPQGLPGHAMALPTPFGSASAALQVLGRGSSAICTMERFDSANGERKAARKQIRRVWAVSDEWVGPSASPRAALWAPRS